LQAERFRRVAAVSARGLFLCFSVGIRTSEMHGRNGEEIENKVKYKEVKKKRERWKPAGRQTPTSWL